MVVFQIRMNAERKSIGKLEHEDAAGATVALLWHLFQVTVAVEDLEIDERAGRGQSNASAGGVGFAGGTPGCEVEGVAADRAERY